MLRAKPFVQELALRAEKPQGPTQRHRRCPGTASVRLTLETAVDRFMALKNLMHKHGDDPLHLFTWWVRSLRARQAPPWDALAVLLLLAGISQPRRRALPGQPMAAHSGASNCGF